ncbi:MAG: TIGR00730 family Rossman fold protein [Coriobacteriales bacterium]|nr:TIGR00730 family Rossman fold protein [Coriobacteriales bacterium]
MNIVVYCGSSYGDDPAFGASAHELGEWIASQGHTLVYGGSNSGLMEIVANSALAANGKVIGVEVQILAEKGFAHTGLTKLIMTPNMSVRRKTMLDLGDAYIALPGGMGTLDEISEAAVMKRIGLSNKPCIALNINGYYDPLIELCKRMCDHGFHPAEQRSLIEFATSVAEISKILQPYAGSNTKAHSPQPH